jgi:hypothetical protein
MQHEERGLEPIAFDSALDGGESVLTSLGSVT